jgi:hypothetical protein
MEKQTLTFTLERETRNMIQYVEDFRYLEEFKDKPPAIGTLRVQRWILGDVPPRKLAVTIGEAEG